MKILPIILNQIMDRNNVPLSVAKDIWASKSRQEKDKLAREIHRPIQIELSRKKRKLRWR